jgi:hypothetical protein
MNADRPFDVAWERALCRAIPRDRKLARAFEEVGSRRHSPARLLDPRLAPHVVRGLLPFPR